MHSQSNAWWWLIRSVRCHCCNQHVDPFCDCSDFTIALGTVWWMVLIQRTSMTGWKHCHIAQRSDQVTGFAITHCTDAPIQSHAHELRSDELLTVLQSLAHKNRRGAGAPTAIRSTMTMQNASLHKLPCLITPKVQVELCCSRRNR